MISIYQKGTTVQVYNIDIEMSDFPFFPSLGKIWWNILEALIEDCIVNQV